MKKGIYIICMIIIFSISLSVFAGCSINNNKSINTNVSSETDYSQITSDQELINIALNISKEENNYTYWLFSSPVILNSTDIIQVEYTYTINDDTFSSFYEYVPVSEFDSVQDFINNASSCLSSEYIENYLYKYLGLHPSENVVAPILIDIDGVLYKQTCIDGISIVPNYKYTDGEVLEKTDSFALVRLYTDSNNDYEISYTDFPLILENNVWKHNPHY